MRSGFFIKRHNHGNVIYNTTWNQKRAADVLGPIMYSQESFSEIFYGNSLKTLVSLEVSPNRRRIQFSGPNLTLVSSDYDENFEVVPNTTLVLAGYDPTTRPWYQMIEKATFPNHIWSRVWFHFIFHTLSIACVSKLDFGMVDANGTTVEEIIGVQYDLEHMDYLLNVTQMQNMDTYTGSIQIVLVERNGLLVASSFHADPVVADQRRHLSNVSDEYAQIARILEEKHVLGNGSDWNFVNMTNLIIYHGRRYSVQSIKDNGLDWIMITATEEHGYVQVMLLNSPVLLSISIALIFSGTILMVILTHLVTRWIYKVVDNMCRLSKLEIHGVKTSRYLNLIRELSMLQKATVAIKRGLTCFMHYVPTDIVCDIVRIGRFSNLGMVNSRTTIMFTDIEDFTNIAESIPISILLQVLTAYFTIITTAVANEGGVIDKFIGDGVMALFSHPLRILPNHALHACKAALEVISEIEKLQGQAAGKGWPPITIRVGINTGDCMIGNIGSMEHFSYTAIGDCVNTASRLEMLNKRYGLSVLIGQSTYEEVKDTFLCFFVDTVRLKGKTCAVDVFTIETLWTNATKEHQQIHDLLTQARTHMIHEEYEEMNQVLVKLERLLEEWQMKVSGRTSGSLEKGCLFTNMKFVKDLVERSAELMKMETTAESSLLLTEK